MKALQEIELAKNATLRVLTSGPIHPVTGTAFLATYKCPTVLITEQARIEALQEIIVNVRDSRLPEDSKKPHSIRGLFTGIFSASTCQTVIRSLIKRKSLRR
jgi:hypothetical protein